MHTLQAHAPRPESAGLAWDASMQSTEVYLRADPTEKLEALAEMTPTALKPGRFRAPDRLMAVLTKGRSTPEYAE
jgi:integrase/recombinase XerD